MIGHGFIGLLQSADYVRPPIRTTGVGPGTIVETAAGYEMSGFADTSYAWLDAPKSSGKWYWEAVKGGDNLLFGIADDVTTAANYAGYPSNNAGLYTYGTSPSCWVESGWGGSWSVSPLGGPIADGDFLGFALDVDGKTLGLYQNNTLMSVLTWSAAVAPIWPLFAFQAGPAAGVNLGPGGCVYDPPDGYGFL